MMRQLRQLDRLDAKHGLGAATPSRAVRRTTADWLPFVIAPVALLALAVVVPGAMPVEVRRFVGLGPERLGSIVEVTSSGNHTFMHTLPGSEDPVTWDPCKPVRYAINPSGGPSDGVALVKDAVQVTARLTGLKFEYVGLTDDRPAWQRPFIPTMGSSRKAALISWATSDEVKALAGDVAGVGGAASVQGDHGRMRLLGGGVTLDIDAFDLMSSWPEGRAAQRGVILHELGHLVGLGHVDDVAELMAPDGSVREFGPGDREGLAILGQGECG